MVEKPGGEAAEPEVGAEAGGGGQEGLRRHPGAAEGGDPGLDKIKTKPTMKISTRR